MSTDQIRTTEVQFHELDVPETERYQLLADPERRVTLAVLGSEVTRPSLDELAAAVAAHVPESDHGSIKTTLHHVHLPMLAAVDVIHYDSETKQIEDRR
jgi:hypothetical protein